MIHGSKCLYSLEQYFCVKSHECICERNMALFPLFYIDNPFGFLFCDAVSSVQW